MAPVTRSQTRKLAALAQQQQAPVHYEPPVVHYEPPVVQQQEAPQEAPEEKVSLMNVFVKTLSGELLSLEVDPSLGFKGVANTLSRFDPVVFPMGRTMIFSEEPLAEGVVVGAYVNNDLEAIDAVDYYSYLGGKRAASYRFRIRAHRLTSMKWMPADSSHYDEEHLELPQYFEIAYNPARNLFRKPGQYSLEKLSWSVGKRFKNVRWALQKTIRYDGDAFTLYPEAIQRIETLIHQWIQQNIPLESIGKAEYDRFAIE